jgi:protein-disulfide isomerase
MSRSRTRERREERQRQQRRQRQLALVGGLIVLAALAVVVIILANQPGEAPIPEGSVERYAGISQSLTDDGYPMIGSPDAPVEVIEYSSFDCTHCQEFHEAVTVNLIDRVRAGDISFTYVPVFGTGSVTNGEGAAKAAICVAEQDAFWPYHDALFTWQSQYGNTAFAQNRLASGVDNLGLNRAEWEQCLRSDQPDRVALSPQEAQAAFENFSGTPTIVINGTMLSAPLDLTSVNAAIDQALAFSPPSAPATEATPEPEASDESTDEATAETTETP